MNTGWPYSGPKLMTASRPISTYLLKGIFQPSLLLTLNDLLLALAANEGLGGLGVLNESINCNNEPKLLWKIVKL